MDYRLGTRASLAAICCLMLAAEARPAAAQGFFDSLFGGSTRRATEFPPVPRRQARPPTQALGQDRGPAVAPARISAPSYYTYKADALKKIALPVSPAISIAATIAAGADFHEAALALGDQAPAAERQIADAVAAYYTDKPQFIWVSGFAPNDHAQSVLRVLAEAGTQGLEPADYSVDVPSSGATVDPQARLADLMRFELSLSARALRYVNDAGRGRVDPNRISGYYDLQPKPLDPKAALRILAASPDPAAYLLSRHPDNAEYRALRTELEALRATAENDVIVDAAMKLKPGESHADLPNLFKLIERKADDSYRAEFGPAIAAHTADPLYAEDLVPALKAAQKIAGLKPDGVIGPRTVAAFAEQTVADRIGKVEVAMEQLRWLPSDFGSRHVFVNQPAYVATYVEGGVDKLSMRVVVGKPTNQTSFFSDEIEQVDYNPYWGVPQSIIVNEMLPRLRNDPGYLDRSGYEVTDDKGRHIPSSAINWSAYGNKVPFNVRQSPSEANALGELKILFPNKNAIYMHDTPQKEFFKRDVRALSHGCIRLQDPRGMAAAVLGTTVDHVAEKVGEGHSSERLPVKIPIYIAYFTAWPDRSGKVDYFADVYGRDARVLKAMETTESVRQAGA